MYHKSFHACTCTTKLPTHTFVHILCVCVCMWYVSCSISFVHILYVCMCMTSRLSFVPYSSLILWFCGLVHICTYTLHLLPYMSRTRILCELLSLLHHHLLTLSHSLSLSVSISLSLSLSLSFCLPLSVSLHLSPFLSLPLSFLSVKVNNKGYCIRSKDNQS